MAPSRSRTSPVVSDGDGGADNSKPWKKCRNKAAIYAAQLNEVVDELRVAMQSLPSEVRPEFVAQVRRNVDSLLTSCQLHGTLTNDRTVTGNKQAAMTLLVDVEPLHKFVVAYAPASQCSRVLSKAVGVLRPLQMTPRDQKHVTAAEKRKARARSKHAPASATAAPATVARSRTRSRCEVRPAKAATPAALGRRMPAAMRQPIEDRTDDDDDDSEDSSSEADSDDDDALVINKAHRPHAAVSLEDSLAESSARRMAAGHLVATASDGDADYDEDDDDESEDTDTYSYTDTGASTSDMQSPAHIDAAAPEMTVPPYDYAMYGAEAYTGADVSNSIPSFLVTSVGPVLAEPSLPPTHESPFYPVRSGSSMLPVLSARPSTEAMFEGVHIAGLTQAAARHDSWPFLARVPGAFSEFPTLSNESPSALYLTDDLSTPYSAPAAL